MFINNKMEKLTEAFQPIQQQFLTSKPILELAAGAMTKAQYRSILREQYHQVREHPQMHTALTTKFAGKKRAFVKSFFDHATAEYGHEQLALNDFATLGGDASFVPYENPLPATTALLAFGNHQIYHLNPVGYLGYVFFLEFIPTSTGGSLLEMLKNIGVGDNAVSFLRDHAEVDVHHNRLMERYVDGLITSEADFDAVVYALWTTSNLYLNMMTDAMEDATVNAERGWNWRELEAENLTPELLTQQMAQKAG